MKTRNRKNMIGRGLMGIGKTLLIVAVVAATAAAPAAVIDISGDLTQALDDAVGAGNSARLVGDTKTHWAAETSYADVDLNGYEFLADTGNGNAHWFNGAITGPGGLRINGRFDATWNPDVGFGGSTANSPQAVFINQGRATLGKDAGIDALAGPITVAGTAIIDLRNSEQINNASTIDATSSAGDFSILLGGYTETVDGLAMNAGHIVDTGVDGGTLTLGALTVDGISYSPGTYTSSEDFVTGTGSVEVIPEPASGALLVLVGGLVWFVRRKVRA